MEVRPAEPEDAERIAALTGDAWWAAYAGFLPDAAIREGLASGYDEAFVREALAERDDLLFVVCEAPRAAADSNETDRDPRDAETGIVGYASAQQTWADEVAIHALFVAPDRWREGVGTALLDAVAASARDADVDRLRVETFRENRVGRAFLEARGFDRRTDEPFEIAVGDVVREAVAYERAVPHGDGTAVNDTATADGDSENDGDG